jgi:ribosome-associated protein
MAKADPIRKNLQSIHDALEDAKALDVTVLDVQKISDFTDYMVIATGTSTRHVTSVADKVIDALRAKGVRPSGVEGMEVGEWVLIDFGGTVVHVMRQQARDFYNLEKLWGEGMPVDVAPKPKAAKAPRAPKKAKATARKRVARK